MIDETLKKGKLTELHCIIDFTNLGYRCLTPVDDGSKYDVVVDLNGRFIRIQCKTACWATDTAKEKVAFMIHTYSQTTNTKSTTRHKYDESDIDYFYTWFEGQGYLVSIKEASGLTFRWRYEYPSSNQKAGIHIASNYEIKEVIKAI